MATISDTVDCGGPPKITEDHLPAASYLSEHAVLGHKVVPNKRSQKQPASKVNPIFSILTEYRGGCGFLLESSANDT